MTTPVPASPPPNRPSGQPTPPKQPLSSAGIFCIVVGLLMALPAGACTGCAAIMLFVDGGSAGEAMSIMGLVLLFAGLPLAGGIALVAVGLRQRKPAA